MKEATNGHEQVIVEANVGSVPNGAPIDQIKKPLSWGFFLFKINVDNPYLTCYNIHSQQLEINMATAEQITVANKTSRNIVMEK